MPHGTGAAILLFKQVSFFIKITVEGYKNINLSGKSGKYFFSAVPIRDRSAYGSFH